MSFNNSYSYDEDLNADQITYEILFREWIKTYFSNSSNDNLIANESLRSTFNELISMFNPENDPKYIHKKTLKNIVVIIFYCLIILVSLFGNLLVCYIILSRPRLRSRPTNVLIANLTFSDLLMTTFSIPITTARLLLDSWPFGIVLCKLAPFIQAMSVYVSTLSMTIIAIDRYQALVDVPRTRLTTTLPMLVIIILIWIVSGILSLPHTVFNEVVEMFTYKQIIRCRAEYPDPDPLYRQSITVITFLTQYLIPLLITMIMYIRISVRIWKRVGIGAMTEQQMSRHTESKKKTIKMLAIVVIVFSSCWLPLNIYHIRADFGLGYYSSTSFLMCHWLAMSSVCYNPFIYFWLNKQYSKIAKYIFLYCFSFQCCRQQKPQPNTITSLENGNILTIQNESSEHRLKRTNALKVSRNRKERNVIKRIVFTCDHRSISTSGSSSSNQQNLQLTNETKF